MLKLMVLQQTFRFQMVRETAPAENNSWISSPFRSRTEAAKRRVGLSVASTGAVQVPEVYCLKNDGA